jgi:hypothetical protein
LASNQPALAAVTNNTTRPLKSCSESGSFDKGLGIR